MATKNESPVIEVSVRLSEQRDVADLIEKVVVNIAKTNLTSRTAKNRATKEATLNELWEQFLCNHQHLTGELLPDHPYIKDDLHAATLAVLQAGREKLETWPTLVPPGLSEQDSQSLATSSGSANTAQNTATSASPRTSSSSPGHPTNHPSEEQATSSGAATTAPISATGAYPKTTLGQQPPTPTYHHTGHGIAWTLPADKPILSTSSGRATLTNGQPAGLHQHGHLANVSYANPENHPLQLPHTGLHQQGHQVLWTSAANAPHQMSIMSTGFHQTGQQGPWSSAANGLQYTQLPPTGPHQQGHHGSWSADNRDSRTHFPPPAAPKLAPITVPIFNGEWKKWTTFIGLFESLIDTNPYLAPVQKLQYLLNYVEGDAKDSIAHIVLTNENYSIALEILRRRFNNERKICDDYVNKILDLPRMEQRSAEGILNISTALTLSLHGLNQCRFQTTSWAPIVVACVTRKLDEESRQKFEESLMDSRKVPTLEILIDFLDRRYQVLLTDAKARAAPAAKKKSFAAVNQPPTHTTKDKPKPKCPLCHKEGHYIRECSAFLKMKPQERYQSAKSKKLCLNCLGDHDGKCGSRFTCRTCQAQHHTLLHLERPSKSLPAGSPEVTHNHLASKGDHVLLATALVKVRNIFGQHETLRALIDPGSQDSFITVEAANSLALQKTRAHIKVSGLGGANAGKIIGKVELNLQAHFPTTQQFMTTALVLPKLTSKLPETALSSSTVPDLPWNLMMADPAFDEPGPIDLLLGADIFAEIVKDGLKKFNENRLLLQNTELGWILTGRLLEPAPSRHTQSLITMTELDEKMKTFWEMEEMPPQPDVRNQLDEFFERTTTRDDTGRYTVRLPKKDNVYGELGASRNMAVARFINLEKSFEKNPHLASEYSTFLKEYEDLGHMTKVPAFAGPESAAYYLPHHAVIKESSTTTKVRVVFNASAKTPTGLSLNSLLDPGYKQQQDLHQIILRWRKHQFVITADIEKMFRQIIVAPEDRDLQRIIWREKPADPISEYQLNTVTYGTASATYLAVRTLIQLARDEGHQFPLANDVLLRDFYMDDLLSGEDTIAETLRIQTQITTLLTKGGFNIRKWTSNCKELMDQIPEELRETGDWLLNPEATIKTLGVVWNPQRDEFRIRLNIDDFLHQKLTKRTLLSNIATIFDPLGFLAPISFTCKTWMQQLWKEETDWDQQVSDDIEQKWLNLRNELPLINEMIIPRWMQYTTGVPVQLHGFCDASEKGYAAVLYSRIVDSNGQVHINLLTSKSKVAPLKNRLTLPRMELAGAVLVAQLAKDAVQSLELAEPEVFFWCDSQIALAWIAKPPATWTTFVANRVASIQQMSSTTQWRYVNTKDNPADIASRGCTPSTLQHHPLWWHGPSWLRIPTENWPSAPTNSCTDLEMKPSKSTCLVVAPTPPHGELLERYSSFNRLIRVTAWILRFKNRSTQKSTTNGALQPEELLVARCKILRLLQAHSFGEEILALQRKLPLPRRSIINSLAPYLDESGLLRIGGRLRQADLPDDAKHPVLLPRQHHLTKALIREVHLKTLHGGAQLTLSVLRQTYWISNGRSTVQSVVRSCGRCRRFATNALPQRMGDLPASRITATPAFTHTGVDYCGPFLYRCSKGRGIKTTKGYVAVFVCFATKAVHLELVSDLTTAAFLAALKRFTSRRGLPLEINSDNGTNFQGASKELKQQFGAAIQEASAAAAELLANDGVTWRFIPVASPHIGGLWEAGVKSVKNHMKRILDNTKLTYEEFSTLLCQIEACLNSRPLYAISNDPTDVSALTPGHFLITRPILAPPEPAILDANPVNRWKLLTKLHQDFWQRWSAEYLTQLQQRTKWKNEQRDPVIGELVLLKERNLPPTKWALGRITTLHPGADQKVRLVTIRTKGNQLIKQPLVNLCRIPCTEDQDQPLQTSSPKQSRTFTVYRLPPQRKTPPVLVPLLLMMTALIPCQAISILKPKPGLYIEKLGQCQVKRGTLRVQMDISYAEIDSDNQSLDAIGRNLATLLSQWQAKHDEPPSELIQYTQLYKSFDRKRTHVSARITELKATRHRDKRGFFGKLLTTVFGVNDEVYAEMELLQKGQITSNQNHLRLNTMLERASQDLQQRYQDLDQSLHNANSAINALNLQTHSHTIINHIFAAYTHAMVYLEEVTAKYDALEKAITGTGSILEIIPLSQVNAVIVNATDRLPPGFYVRHVPEDRLEMKTTGAQLTLYGFFPIASIQPFELVHVTPIPELRNSTFILPTVTSRTIALNYNEQTYFELNEGQLAACHLIRESLYLCESPVLSTMNFSRCSILSELYNRTNSPTCDHTALAINGVLWQKLLMPNTWLFATNSSTPIAVICNGEREDQNIEGSGILNLDTGCIIKTSSHTIGSFYHLNIRVTETFLKETPITLGNLPADRLIVLKDPPPITNPTALISGTLLATDVPLTDHPLIYHPISWISTAIIAACIYYFYHWKKKKLPPPSSLPNRRHSAPSLGARFDSMIASLAPPACSAAADQRV